MLLRCPLNFSGLGGGFAPRHLSRSTASQNMRRFLIIFILVLSVCAVVPAQRSSTFRVKLNKNKPSVYISLVRVGKPKSLSDDQSREFVWLRLNNNTRWAIGLDASGENNKESDVSLYYDIVSEDDAVLEIRRCHVCSRIPLGSGKSLVFSIPKEDFAEKSYLKIRFSFDWQSDDGSSFAAQDEYENIVSFSERDLPKDAPKE